MFFNLNAIRTHYFLLIIMGSRIFDPPHGPAPSHFSQLKLSRENAWCWHSVEGGDHVEAGDARFLGT
jgi:hypothetical protein